MNGLMRIFIEISLLFYRLLYRVRIEGLDNLPSRGPFILSSNELSTMGSQLTSLVVGWLVLSGRMEPPVSFFDEYMMTMKYANLFTSHGGQPIFPHGRGQGAGALLGALESLRSGKILLMNAMEMSWEGRALPLKSGPSWLALRSGLPIVLLVATKGAYDIQPKWAERPHWTGRFAIRIGKPLYLTDAPCNRVTDEMLRSANERFLTEMNALVYG